MKHNGPNDAAFARPATVCDGDSMIESHSQDGLTVREWYAGQALAGFIAHYAGTDTATPSPALAAEWAFNYADAMLAQARK
jgi:hypothetical protein